MDVVSAMPSGFINNITMVKTKEKQDVESLYYAMNLEHLDKLFEMINCDTSNYDFNILRLNMIDDIIRLRHHPFLNP